MLIQKWNEMNSQFVLLYYFNDVGCILLNVCLGVMEGSFLHLSANNLGLFL